MKRMGLVYLIISRLGGPVIISGATSNPRGILILMSLDLIRILAALEALAADL